MPTLVGRNFLGLVRPGTRLRLTAGLAVPRERFVGPGPWRVRNYVDRAEYWTTEDADRRHVYRDVLIALHEPRAMCTCRRPTGGSCY
jgi:protein-L-isoaspartate(D-aspartate) O-methyltransferase